MIRLVPRRLVGRLGQEWVLQRLLRRETLLRIEMQTPLDQVEEVGQVGQLVLGKVFRAGIDQLLESGRLRECRYDLLADDIRIFVGLSADEITMLVEKKVRTSSASLELRINLPTKLLHHSQHLIVGPTSEENLAGE